MERFQVPLDVAGNATDSQRLKQAFAFQRLVLIGKLIQAVGDALDEMANVRNLNRKVLGGISNSFLLRRYELPCAGSVAIRTNTVCKYSFIVWTECSGCRINQKIFRHG
jgi:hypothetical protein